MGWGRCEAFAASPSGLFGSRLGRAVCASIGLPLALTLLSLPARADFQSLETEDLRLLYSDLPHSFIAPYTARCFENSMRFYRDLFAYEPSEKVTVFLMDPADYGNAAAWTAPRNSIVIQLAPANFIYETGPTNERINFAMNHEVAHIVAHDQAAGSDRFFRTLFGGKVRETPEHPETIVYGLLTHPRNTGPRWYHEGTAVFLETWMAGGLGRVLGAYDEMVFRAMVRDGTRFYDPLGLESEGTKIDFQVGVNSYLYGTRFVSYLALTRAPEDVVRWVGRTPGSRRSYLAQFEEVFGLPLEQAWAEWIAWERGFQEENLASIRRYATTPFEDISRRALGSISRPFLDASKKTLYVAADRPGEVSHIVAIDLEDGTERKIAEVKDPALYFVTSLAYDPAADLLFYTTDNNEWRDVCSLDPATGRQRVLLKDVRIGDLAFDRTDRSLWGVRHFNGISTLVRIPYPYEEWNQVYSWPYGQVLYDLDLAPDGRTLAASMAEISGRQTLRLLATDALLAGDTTSVATYSFGSAVPSNFVFSADGRYLHGSSYYTGVSNVFRYEVATGEMAALTNAETGFFRPLVLGSDSLVVFRYSGEGFVPARIAARPLEDLSPIEFLGQKIVERHPVVKSWNVGSPASVDLEARTVRKGPYSGLRSLGLSAIYPIVEGYKDGVATGLAWQLTDPGYVHTFEMSASFSPDPDVADSERFHGRASYERGGWKASYAHNPASFYDLFGPTKTSRKGQTAGLRYRRPLLSDRPKSLELVAAAHGYFDLERLPDYQNVAASFDHMVAGDLGLRYENLRSSLGAIDHEKGWSWSTFAMTSYVHETAYPAGLGTIDLGFPLPLHHSSLWLRNAGGYSPEDRDDPFANFYFGGFGNNWVDHQEIKRFREYYSLPGLELNELSGTNFAKSLVEWILPPVRFRRAGTTTLYATWLRTTVFGGVIATDLDEPGLRRTVGSAGVQADLRLMLFSRLKLTVSGGYAAAFEEGVTPRDETMVSLKVL